MIDITRRHRMVEAFKATHGEEAAMTLAESLYSTDHATKADLERFATKADLEGFATKADLAALEARLEKHLSDTINKHLWRFQGLIVALIATVAAQQVFS